MGVYRNKLTHFADAIVREWKRTLLFFAVLLTVAATVKHYFHEFVFNLTPSIDGKIYRMKPDKPIDRYRVVVFPHKNPAFPEGVEHMTKQVMCLPGDTLRRNHLAFFCNGTLIAQAKTQTKTGFPLEVFDWTEGKIPAGFFFAGSPHPDGFDSRYIGLVPLSGATVVERVL